MLERTVLPETPRPAHRLRLPRQLSVPPQFVQFALIVWGIAGVTFILFLYVLPNSQINAAHTKIAQLREQQAELQRQNAEVLQEIARYSDLKSLESRARQLGMGPVQSAIYLRLPISSSQQAGDQASRVVTPSNDRGVLAPATRPLTASILEQRVRQVLDRAAAWVDESAGRLLGK